MTREDTTWRADRRNMPLALVLIGAVAMLGAPTRAVAQNVAVQFDAASASPGINASPYFTSLSWSHTVGNYSDRWLIVGISLRGVSGQPYYDYASSVTFDGVALTRFNAVDHDNNTMRVEQWELQNPAVGTHTIVVNLQTATAAVASAVSFYNAVGRRSSGCNRNTGTLAGVSVNSITRDGMVDTLAVLPNVSATVYTSPQTQTERWNAISGTGTSDILGAGSTRPGSGSTAFDTASTAWNLSASSDWAICLADLQPPTNPTLAHIRTFTAAATPSGTIINWNTSYEVDNLGFRLFRENADGSLAAVTPSLIAGSALFVGQGTALAAGRSYQWLDTANRTGSDRYWLKEVSLDGASQMFGPIVPKRGRFVASAESLVPAAARNSGPLSAVGAKPAKPTALAAAPVVVRRSLRSANSGLAVQWQLAGMNAARIGVRGEGWYRVGKADLLAAGFDPGTDPRTLRLFNRGVEQAISVVPGPTGSFDSDSYIEFYGTGLDTTSTDLNAYWLVNDRMPGQPPRRIETADALGGGAGAASYQAVVERRDRTVYFAALTDPTRDNFFGPTITSDAATQALTLDRISPDQTPAPTLDVAVQGATASDHRVAVSLNGHALGEVDFSGITYKRATLSVDPVYLSAGNNTVSLVALGDSTDVSLVDYVRLSYQRLLYADSDTVDLIGAPLQAVTVKGFTTPHVRVMDVSRPEATVELPGQVANLSDGYAVTVTPVPVYFGPGAAAPQNTLFAFTEEQAKKPASIEANSPSQWHAASNKADLVIITHHDFKDAANMLAQHRIAQGIATQVIDVQEAYDEFSYGAKDPQAIRDLLVRARAVWQRAPRFVLLIGDATFDPRNYLGLGDADFLPTRLVPTAYLKTASDDWFVTAPDGTSLQMAIGRIPVRTPLEAGLIVNRIIGYDGAASVGGWTSRVDFIADADDVGGVGISFADSTKELEKMLPAATSQSSVMVGEVDAATARAQVLDAMNSGALMVNYLGHGTTDSWTKQGLFTADDAMALTNGAKTPVVIAMNCLSGLFEDVSGDSMAEALLKAQNGGAVAVIASSSLTDPYGQVLMGASLLGQLSAFPSLSVGEALEIAKLVQANRDVRSSFLLFGDPSMQLRR